MRGDFFNTAMEYRDEDIIAQRRAEMKMVPDQDKYPEGFFAWLEDNYHVYAEFASRAKRMWRTGRKRYSARTIVEVMRWNSDIRENPPFGAKEALFRINDHITPGMARYFMHENPECKGFFELRGR